MKATDIQNHYIEIISGKGKAFSHFKGGNHIYTLLNIGRLATNGPNDGEEVVIYQNIFDGNVYVRDINEFASPVPEGKENPTGQKFRFERVYDRADIFKYLSNEFFHEVSKYELSENDDLEPGEEILEKSLWDYLKEHKKPVERVVGTINIDELSKFTEEPLHITKANRTLKDI